jgi:ABC-type Fe3+ transport system substrate-binding protein
MIPIGKRSPALLLMLLVALLCACGAPTGAPGSAGLARTENQGADWQAQWDQTLAAAKREGKVTVVTHTNLYYRAAIDKFSQKYPDIEVEHVAMRPSEFSPKVITEQQNGIFGYDVWVSPTSNMVEVVAPADGFENDTPYLILPEVTEPKNWRANKLLYATSEPLVAVYQGNVTSNVYANRDLLPAGQFNNFDQLLDPSLRGKIVIRTPDAPQATSLTMAGILHNKGPEFVERLMRDQQPVFVDNARLLTQDLISGKYPLAMGIDAETLDGCQREGGCKNIEQVRGEYQYLLGYGVGILKNPPHPNAAAVFLNWFLSKEGQQGYVDGIVASTPPPYDLSHSARVDVEPHADAVALGAVPDYTHLEKYSLQGMEAGGPEMQTVLSMYKRVEAGQ